MAAPLFYLLIFNGLLHAFTSSKEDVDKTFSDLKRCTDEECSLLMCRGKATQDFTGPDCRFLEFKKGETIYVYYKLAGRRTDLWAGSVGSRFGYFPKDLLEINHIYTEKELEIPTEDTDFVCSDGGQDHFDSYDVDKLLESVNLKDKSEVVESEIHDSVKEGKNENDDNRSKEENLLHGEKEETRVHENDQNENDDKKSKEENLLVSKKEETNVHKKDESENDEKQNKEEELAVSEKEDPGVQGKDKNDEKQNKDQELADSEKVETAVHEKDKNEIDEKYNKEELPESEKVEAEVHKKDKNENDEKHDTEELPDSEKVEAEVHEKDKNENYENINKEELPDSEKVEAEVHEKDKNEKHDTEELPDSEKVEAEVHKKVKNENDDKQNKEELPDSENVETAVHEKDKNENGVKQNKEEELQVNEKVDSEVHVKDKNENDEKQTKEERQPVSEKGERTVHKTNKDQNENLELDNEEKVLEDSNVSETSEDEKATDVELSTSSNKENKTESSESSGEPQRDSEASVSNGNENINDATLSQKEDLTKTVDGAELKEAEIKTLQEKTNNTVRLKLAFTFDAVVSNDENTRKVTPLYEGADEEENELEATTEGLVEPSEVIPLLPYSKDKEEPERESKDEEPADGLENDEEQTKQDQSHKLDKHAEKHENINSPEKAKSMWTTLGDTVFAIVSGGETTRKVSTIDEDDEYDDEEEEEEEEEDEEEEEKNEEPKKDILYFLDSDSSNAKEEVDLASQDFEETVNVSINHGHQQSENIENTDGRHELDPKSKSDVSMNKTSEVKEHQQNKEDEPAPLTEDASDKLKNTEANTSGSHLVSEGGEQPKNIVDSDGENEEIHSEEDPEVEAIPSSTNHTKNEMANTEVEGSENGEDEKTEDESSPSENQSTESKTQKTKDKEDEELSSEERDDDFTNELAQESEENTTNKEVDEEKEETQEEHETLFSDEETDLEEETLLDDENAAAAAADVDNKGAENNGEMSDNRDLDIDTHDLDDDQNSTKTTVEEDDEQDLGDELTKSLPLQEKEMKVKAEDDEGKDEADKRTESTEEEEEEGGINIKDADENSSLDETANATTSSKAPNEEHSDLNYSESVRELTILKTHFGEKQLQLFYKYLDVHGVFKVEAMFHDLEEELKLARQTSRNTEEIEKSLDDILESSEVSILDQIEKMLDDRETKKEELQQMDKDMADAEASMLEDFQELAFQLRQKYSAASDSTPLAPGVHHHESITDVKSRIPDSGLETEKDENKEFEMNVVDENNEALNSSPVTESPAVLAESDQNDDTTQSWTSTLIDILRAIKKYTVRYFEMLVNALPEDWQPGPTCYGLPWEPVLTTVLVGFISFMIFFWRTVLAVKSRLYQVTEKQLGEKIKQLIDEKQEVLSKISELKEKIKNCEQQIADSEKTKSSASVENEELKETFKELQKINNQMKEKIKTLQISLEEEKNNNLFQEEKISETKAHIDKLQKTIHSTTAELSKAKTRAKEAKHKEETVMAELDVLVQENNKLKQKKNKQLENIKGWEERYKELSEQIKGFQKTQKELEEKLAHKNNEVEVLSDCITELRQLEAEATCETASLQKVNSNGEITEKKNDVIKNKIKQMMDVSRIKTKLTIVEEERERYMSRLLMEEKSRHALEELIKKLEHDHSSLTIEKNRLENDFRTIQQKLEIMNELYQQKENALQQKLSQEEFERRAKEQKLSEVDGKALQAEEQLKIYKMRIQEIEEELQKTERSYKNQIAVHEKKAHENWLNARTAERALVEEKRETSNLRQKLVEVNDKLAALQRPGLIKPTPGRPDRQIPPLRRGTLSHDESFGPSPVCDGGPSPPPMIEGPGRPPSAPVARREPFVLLENQSFVRRPPSENIGRYPGSAEFPSRADAGVSTHPLNASGPRTSSPNAPQEGSSSSVDSQDLSSSPSDELQVQVNSKGQGPPSFPGTPISSPSSGMGLPVRGYAPPPPTGPFPHLNGPIPQMLIGPPNGVPPVPGARFGSLPPTKGPFGPNPYGPALPHNVRVPPPLLRDYPPGPLPPPPAPPLPPFGPRDFVPSLKEHPSGFTPTYAARDLPFPPKGMAPPYIPAPAQVGPRDFQPGPLPQLHGIPGPTAIVQQMEPKDSSA
ncbi:transport and Golgi organization protein 1 homolog isoform X4 [Erpetoichthys calabaricus]|uniref:transport and Golgi organization protein 1 homolog isoform X4 n=1 Tax=Erpetoichthys calabaricus TaxID=27687 RepID=UPI002233F4F8|nr:transport and Golgi organization protein 1 homolog isoform X4 [Erpetoichthys calabaricus]